MRTKFFTLFFLSLSLIVQAQFSSDIVIFNPDGGLFKAYINNRLVSNQYQNKLIVNNLQSDTYILRVVFQEGAYPVINANVYIRENVLTACILEKKSNRYNVDIQEIISYDNPKLQNTGTTVTVNTNVNNNHVSLPPTPMPAETKPHNGCQTAMSTSAFYTFLSTVEAETFEDDKLAIAKQVTQANCLLVSQIQQIIKLFTFENNKLAYAKFAYKYTYDRENYYMINSVFTFPSSKKELSAFINSY